MDLIKKFKYYLQQEKLLQHGDRLLLAVSGGTDSVALCELCKQAGYNFVLAHCNFQLRGAESDHDELFVKKLAAQYQVEFYVKKFDTITHADSNRLSVETAARELRYQWFNELLDTPSSPPLKYILTGHHADDNMETVMMNFFRGTGISGLRGILPRQGRIIRPLLFARRNELEEFVKVNGLQFVTDHTNLENEYTRNYFRNTIIPLVNDRYPEAANNVLKNIQRFKETDILYQQSIQVHKKKLLEQKGNETHIPVLKLLKTTPLLTVVYEIIKDFGFTAHQADEAVALLSSETGKYIQSATHRIIRNRAWLIISPRQTITAGNILIEEEDKLIPFEQGTLQFEKEICSMNNLQTGNGIAQLDAGAIKFPLLLRKWKQGDYFYPLGMQKKKKLSRFFIDQKLSLSRKENTWVLEMDQKIIWIVGLRIDDRFKINPGTKQLLKISLANT